VREIYLVRVLICVFLLASVDPAIAAKTDVVTLVNGNAASGGPLPHFGPDASP